MREQHERLYFHAINRELDVLSFGHAGRPVIVFPTTLGRYHEARDQGLIASVAHLVDEGRAVIYCPGALNAESWYDRRLHPADKARTQAAYDRTIRDELVPLLQQRHYTHHVAVAGCSFGAYTAANFAFKHPDVVSDLVAMSGNFDIRSFLDGYYDDEIYFNNPVDYLPQAQHPRLWQLGIILGTSEWDVCRAATERLAGLLRDKDVPHWLDVRGWVAHDWPLWREMFPDYLARVV